MQRSRSFLIAQAVGEFVEREYASLVAVREGEADIEAGRSIEGDEARAWFEDLKNGRTRVAPATRKRSKTARKRTRGADDPFTAYATPYGSVPGPWRGDWRQ